MVINNFLNNGPKRYCTLYNSQKAFEYVYKELNLFKLIKTRVNGKTNNLMKSMYINVKPKVKLNKS